MSAAWSFLAGWISASLLIFLCIWRGQRAAEPWMDAQDTDIFVQGCQELLSLEAQR